ncbi:MAG TPA: dolichyl-phosphate beta-glucosyltransferase [Anaerolineae bacterium]|nr:dolichyl-phosphate beta-glucosyltransferase [Anaerolineae bacterium]
MHENKRSTSVDIVIPVYNEERDLEHSIDTLRDFFRASFPYRWRIVIADNASVDRTLETAKRLSSRFPEVTYLHLDQKGRGRALRRAWLESDADIVSYMDVDLSTDLESFPPLIDGLAQQRYHVAIGSRLTKGASVERQLKREIISRCYNLLIKVMFRNRFTDAQCGFKALTRKAVLDLVPMVKDQGWFFDSELLLRAEQKGYQIFEVPVAWVDDPDSRVNVIETAWGDLKGLLRVRFT